jgi:hypothetical protein
MGTWPVRADAGFTQEVNPHSLLMVRCPLPPTKEWGEDMKVRASLLARRGLSPQLFLPGLPEKRALDQQVRPGRLLQCYGSSKSQHTIAPANLPELLKSKSLSDSKCLRSELCA